MSDDDREHLNQIKARWVRCPMPDDAQVCIDVGWLLAMIDKQAAAIDRQNATLWNREQAILATQEGVPDDRSNSVVCGPGSIRVSPWCRSGHPGV